MCLAAPASNATSNKLSINLEQQQLYQTSPKLAKMPIVHRCLGLFHWCMIGWWYLFPVTLPVYILAANLCVYAAAIYLCVEGELVSIVNYFPSRSA